MQIPESCAKTWEFGKGSSATRKEPLTHLGINYVVDMIQSRESEINLCRCGHPLVNTMAFRGAEYFCLGCKSTYGTRLFGGPSGGKTEPWTPELHKTRAETREKFKELIKDYIPEGAYYSNCKQCKDNGPHLRHASEADKEKSTQAYKKLMEIK